MDIQQWLQRTREPSSPNHGEDLGFPAFLREKRPTEPQTQKYHHKRKRVRSDSSVLAPTPRNYHPHTDGGASDHVRGDARSPASSCSSSSRRAPSPSISEPERAKKYERRARHKTRADRYDPKPKKLKKDGAANDQKGGRKNRKSRRMADGDRTTGLVQSFELRDGPRNSRLTLKPSASVGVFKHGRASEQLSGRGLPDLVFNEMRFLQKPTEHQDEQHEVTESRKPDKRDRKRVQEEEISAYFNANKPTAETEPPAHHDQHQTRRASLVPLGDKDDNDRIARKRGSKQPPVELPDKLFLGFGSRGARPLSVDPSANSTECFTWSESVRHPLPQKGHGIRQAPTIEARQLAEAPPGRKRRRDIARASLERSRETTTIPAEQPLQVRDEQPRDEWMQTRRARGPALVEMYQPLNHLKRRASGAKRSRTKTSSQSLPAAPDYMSDVRAASDYRTSDILKLREQYQSPAPSQSASQRLRGDGQEKTKESVDPTTSPTSRLLKRAAAAVNPEQHRATVKVVSPLVQPTKRHASTADDKTTAIQHPQARKLRPEDIIRDDLPDNTNDLLQQALHHGVVTETHLDDAEIPPEDVPTPNMRIWPQPQLDRYPQMEYVDDGMLDYQPVPLHYTDNAHNNRDRADDLAMRSIYRVTQPSFLQAQAEPTQPAIVEEHAETYRPQESLFSPSPSVDSRLQRRRTPVSAAEGEFEGFWKPRKLY